MTLNCERDLQIDNSSNYLIGGFTSSPTITSPPHSSVKDHQHVVSIPQFPLHPNSSRPSGTSVNPIYGRGGRLATDTVRPRYPMHAASDRYNWDVCPPSLQYWLTAAAAGRWICRHSPLQHTQPKLNNAKCNCYPTPSTGNLLIPINSN